MESIDAQHAFGGSGLEAGYDTQLDDELQAVMQPGVEGGVLMTFAGIGRLARALDIVEATRVAIRDCLASCNDPDPSAALNAAHRGLVLASDLVASADLNGVLGAELCSLRLNGDGLRSSKCLSVALVDAAALSGVIQAVSPVVDVGGTSDTDSEACLETPDKRLGGYL